LKKLVSCIILIVSPMNRTNSKPMKKLTSAIKSAKDSETFATLREIAEDPHGTFPARLALWTSVKKSN